MMFRKFFFCNMLWCYIREDVLDVQCAVAGGVCRVDNVDVGENDRSAHADRRPDVDFLPIVAFWQIVVECQIVGAVQ